MSIFGDLISKYEDIAKKTQECDKKIDDTVTVKDNPDLNGDKEVTLPGKNPEEDKKDKE